MPSPSLRASLLMLTSVMVLVGFATSNAQGKINTTTHLASSLNPSTYGQSVTLTATVSPASGSGVPTGSVTFKNGTSQTTKTLSGGKATLIISPNAGSYSITATYSGDANYNGSTSPTLHQVVNKATTTTTLTSTPNPSTFGQQVIFTVTVISQYGGQVTGSVAITFGAGQICTVTLTNGVGSCPYATLPVGSDTVTASYGGDSNNLSSSGSDIQIVGPAATTTTLTSSPNPSGYEQTVTFTATVSPVPDGGSVSFIYNNSAFCTIVVTHNGVESCLYPNLPVGSDSVTASYSGDVDYSGSTSSPVIQIVSPVLQSITVSPQNLSVDVGSAPQQYSAEGYYNDGSQQNITNSVTWSSSNTSVATISSGGAESPVSVGSTTISATLNSIQGTSALTVDSASTFFVAPNGNDSWSGTISTPNAGSTDGPFASPSRAQYAIEHASKPATVYLRAGTYYPALTPAVSGSYVTYPGTLVFSTADSGSSTSAQVTWTEFPPDLATGPAVVSGGVPANTDPTSGVGLKLHWNNNGNWYYATLPQYLPLSNGNPGNVPLEPFETLYYNGERRMRARLHDTGTSSSYGTTYSVGYYMSGTNTCSAIGNWQGAEFSTNLASCNLGAFMRVEGTIAPTDPLGSYNGVQCPYATDNSGNEKCLDRFYFVQSTGTGADPVDNWSNLTALPSSAIPSQPPCPASTNYPAGDVELTLFGAWTVDEVRVNCVNATNTPYPVIYLQNPTKAGNGNNFNFMGPAPGHRFVIENSYDGFTAAAGAGQVGIWFLDRSKGLGNWVLNYIANENANPKENPPTDNIVIPQLPQTGASFPAGGQFPLLSSNGKDQNDYIGGGLIWASGLEYVTFGGITFEVDNFYPNNATAANAYKSGFNNDDNGEMPVPQAIDCENCQFVTFNGVTVRHTSASGILAGATAVTTPCSTGQPPTTSSFCDLIENSLFYDIGDSGVRVGHYPQNTDTNSVVQDVLVQNNRVQGFSRTLADGEGITTANGFNNQILNNTVTDGYHAGISICFNSCGHNSQNSTSDGNNISVNNNLISNLMQGITSDGGSLYFNVGGTYNSAKGDQAYGNVVYDTTDSYIIDVLGTSRVAGSGYGGEGIYLDAESADVDVENNVVFNVDGNAIHLTAGLVSSTETPNTFKDNLFAFGNESMFTQGNPWLNGCPASKIPQVDLTDNLFVFDIATGTQQAGRSAAGFTAISGCKDSCAAVYGGTYADYQQFQGNAYWSNAESFGTINDAFQVLQNQGSGTGGVYQNSAGMWECAASPVDDLSFSQWQTGNVPITTDEDPGGSANVNPQTHNPNFPTSGTAANIPPDFTINNASGLGQFNPSGTNAAITGAGSTVAVPSSVCSTAAPVVTVCPTYPTFVYGSGSLVF